VEAATKGRVDQRDGSVGGVHGDDEPEIAWQLERLVGPVERADLLAPVLEEEEQLPEDPRQVPTVISSISTTWRTPGALFARSARVRNGPSVSAQVMAPSTVSGRYPSTKSSY
jgi:hypothetical protein